MHHDLQISQVGSYLPLLTFLQKWLLLHVEPLAALLFAQLGYSCLHNLCTLPVTNG